MELFVIKNTSGKQVGAAFSSKGQAKTARNELQVTEGGGLPPLEKRQDQSLWSFHISKGQDHFRINYYL